MSIGKVWLVGAGPSDPGLFTLKGKRVLEDADVVVFDKLVGQGVLNLIPPKAECIDVGKIAGNHPVPQEEINRILLREAQKGKKVVRLKGGDPFLFGRGGEELGLLIEHNIPFEIVPGVTSAIAVPAYAGIPVTHRDFCSSLHIITGHGKNGETDIPYHELAKIDGTLVFLMGVKSLPHICNGLIEAGMDPATPAAVLERGTTAKQRRVVETLGTLHNRAEKAGIISPSVIVVGGVCALSESMHWAEDRPLGGLRVVNVRPRDRNSKLTELLQSLGAEVIEFPCIRTQELVENHTLEKALGNLSRYSWIVLTSPFGAKTFFNLLRRFKLDIRELRGVKFAAIGNATAAEIEKMGIQVDYVPKEYCARTLGEGMCELAGGKRILIPRAKEGSPELTAVLAGTVEYDEVPIYETHYDGSCSPAASDAICSGQFDYVMFTSASTVRGFHEATKGKAFSEIHAVCIGRETEKQARAFGFDTATARQATIKSMTEKLIELKKGER